MKESNYTVQKNRVIYNDNTLIVVDDVIKEYIIIDGIVLLLDPSKSKSSRNIYCYDFAGRLKWQIALLDQLHHENYYTSIYLSEQNVLQAYNINGIEITINKQDGSILKKELIK